MISDLFRSEDPTGRYDGWADWSKSIANPTITRRKAEIIAEHFGRHIDGQGPIPSRISVPSLIEAITVCISPNHREARTLPKEKAICKRYQSI